MPKTLDERPPSNRADIIKREGGLLHYKTLDKPPLDNRAADIKREGDRLLGLLFHFRIPYNHPDRWFALALALARKHYPQGAPNPVGRPKKWSIAKLYAAQLSAWGRKRGRPRKYRPEEPVRPRGRPSKWREIIEGIRVFVEEYREGDPRATDKDAITNYLKGYARHTKRSEQRVLVQHLRPLQKALSRYRGELRRQSQ